MAANENIQTLRMTDEQYARLAQYADDNSMSVSEALREVLGVYARGEVTPPHRKRRSRRLAVWVPPDQWLAFTTRAGKDKVSITDAVEAALKDNL